MRCGKTMCCGKNDRADSDVCEGRNVALRPAATVSTVDLTIRSHTCSFGVRAKFMMKALPDLPPLQNLSVQNCTRLSAPATSPALPQDSNAFPLP